MVRRGSRRPPDEVYLRLVGGRGLVAYLLLKHTPAGVDALGPGERAHFCAGRAAGQQPPLERAARGGGEEPAHRRDRQLRGRRLVGPRVQADAATMRWSFTAGRSRPSTSSISDGSISLRPADHLWGQDTADVQAAIRAELGDDKVRVAQIGVAGENGVLFSAIMHDVNRAAGRNGLGAVMGSKNLKAVAVRGTQNVPQGNRQRTLPVTKWIGQDYKRAWPGRSRWARPAASLSPREDEQPARPQLPGSRFPDAKSIDGKLMAATIRNGARHLPGLPGLLQAGGRVRGPSIP